MSDREKIAYALNATEISVELEKADIYKFADALIENGYGDVNEWKERAGKHRVLVLPDGTIKQIYSNEEVEEISRQRDEYKHRAEVAERALMSVCTNVIKDEKDDVAVEPRARVLYKVYLGQAEKELAEEGKDE